MRRALLVLMAAIPLQLSLQGCSGGDKDEDDDGDEDEDDTGSSSDTDGDDGGDDGGSTTTGCPDEVPDAYQYIWDCQAETCDGPMLYRYGVGSSDADGDIEVVEQWFLFSGGGEYCIDTFEIDGESSVIDPTTFNCSQCEETYEVSWDHTGMDCGVIWGGIFFGQDGQSEEAPYDGFLMFDTHTAFGDRNEDNGALVVGAPVLGNSYFPKPDWARGTATPSGAEDGPPEDYVYVNAGSCLGMKGTSGRTVLSPEDDTPQRTESTQAP